MFNWLALFIATACFSGFIPQLFSRKPMGGAGTIGSILAMLIQIFLLFYFDSVILMLLMAIGSYFLGIIVMDRAEKMIMSRWGSQLNHNGEDVDHDFNQTCIDEVHGQFVAGLPIFFFPELSMEFRIWALVISMICFRFFDVFKPGIIKKIEDNVAGAAGVMLDDTAAGAFSALIIFVAISFF